MFVLPFKDVMDQFLSKFSLHQRVLSAMSDLLSVKSDIDKKYSDAHKYLSEEFHKLSDSTHDREVKDVVSALARNFGNISSHLE